ncbi:MAG: PD40 domain-containing protein [Sphingobacteriales bacterium]|nr:PD40 domain-containing protein [Sphingobacteriales bacterium]
MKKITLLLTLFFCITTNYLVVAQNATLKAANEAFEQFGYKDAIVLYKEVLEKDKQNIVAAEKLADCYRLTSNTKMAEPAYKKAIKLNPQNDILKFYYGKALMSNEKYEEALKYFNEYKAAKPTDKLVYNFIDACKNIDDLKRDSSAYKIALVPTVNSMEGDFSPVFFKDGLVITSFRNKNTLNRKNDQNGDSYADMYFVKQLGVHWTPGALMEGKQSTPYNEGPATFSADGTVMYFTRNAPKSKAKKTGESHLQIYESRWSNNHWSEGVVLPFCDENYSMGHPTLSADGRKLYFSSNMPGGLGENDIWVSELQNGKWSKPENMGSNVNTAANEMFPFIHPDGTLYFASDGWGGFGGLDIFSATPVAEDWTVANMGTPINTARDDHGLVLNPDKTLGYLASNRKRENDDIFEVKIQASQAQKLLVEKAPEIAQKPEKKQDDSKLIVQEKLLVVKTDTQHKQEGATLKGINASPVSIQEQTPVEPDPIEEKINKIFNKDNSMAIIGIVVDKSTKIPMSGAFVELKDLSNSVIKKVVTKEDGNFMFSVQPSKQYNLTIVGEDGVQDQRFVSTINPKNTLVFYSILEGVGKETNAIVPEINKDSYNNVDPHLVETKMDVKKDNVVKPILPMSNNNSLTFKVQIGAFSRPLSTSTRYFGKVRNRAIEKEISQNGQLHRYLTGNTNSFAEAETLCRSLNNSGYRTAFVVGYLGGNRLDMDIQTVLSTYGKQ